MVEKLQTPSIGRSCAFRLDPNQSCQLHQFEKRTSLNVFRFGFGSQPRAASKIEDALRFGKFACS